MLTTIKNKSIQKRFYKRKINYKNNHYYVKQFENIIYEHYIQHHYNPHDYKIHSNYIHELLSTYDTNHCKKIKYEIDNIKDLLNNKHNNIYTGKLNFYNDNSMFKNLTYNVVNPIYIGKHTDGKEFNVYNKNIHYYNIKIINLLFYNIPIKYKIIIHNYCEDKLYIIKDEFIDITNNEKINFK